MRTTTLLGLCACLALALGGYSLASASKMPARRSLIVNVRGAGESVILTPPDTKHRDELCAYVLTVMQGWPPPYKLGTVPLPDVAASIADVAAHDAPAWPDDTTGARSAVLLAALAYFEGDRFASYVDDGTCNKPGFRLHDARARYGTCDGGLAHSLWQIHEIELADPLEVASATTLTDRTFAAHIALRLARQSLAATGTLQNYTGEWSGPHPKADERLKFALKASAAQPF